MEERTHPAARREAARAVCGRGASGGRGARRPVVGGGGGETSCMRGWRGLRARELGSGVHACGRGGCADAVRGLLTGG